MRFNSEKQFESSLLHWNYAKITWDVPLDENGDVVWEKSIALTWHLLDWLTTWHKHLKKGKHLQNFLDYTIVWLLIQSVIPYSSNNYCNVLWHKWNCSSVAYINYYIVFRVRTVCLFVHEMVTGLPWAAFSVERLRSPYKFHYHL